MDFNGQPLDGDNFTNPFNDDLVINGDLNVNGTATIDTLITVDELEVKDPIITMGVGNPAENFNLGYLEESFSGASKWSGIIRNHLDRKHYLLHNVAPKPAPGDSNIASLTRGQLVVGEATSASIIIPGGTVDAVLTNDGDALVTTLGTGAEFHFDDNGSMRAHFAVDAVGPGPGVDTIRSRGTLASPTALQNDDAIYEVFTRGFDGVNSNDAGYRLIVRSTEAWSTGNHGSKAVFFTPNDGTETLSAKIELNTGGVKLNDAYYMPTADGAADQVIVAAGDGTTSWQTPAGSTSVTRSTGVFSGGVISANVDTTLFDISAGTGQIVDPNTGIVTLVSWSAMIGENGTYATLQTYVLIDNVGAVVKTGTKPTNADIRDNILLGVLVSVDTVNIAAIAAEQMFLGNSTNQISDLAAALGHINTSGNVMGPSTLLTVAKSTGSMFAFGANAWVDLKNPSNITTVALDTNVSDTFGYFYQDGSSSGPVTSIIPSEYDDGNGQASPGTVTSNRWQTQRVYLFPEGGIVILPGQATYNNLADAQAALNTEVFNTLSNVASNGLLISYIFVRGGATDLNTTPGDAEFLQASRLSGGSGDVAGGNVNGPVSSTINSLCKFSTTDGKTIKDNSGAILTDAGLLTVPDLTVSNNLIIEGALDYNLATLGNDLMITNANDGTEYRLDDIGFFSLNRAFTGTGGSGIDVRRSRGTLTTPIASADNDAISEFWVRGHDGVGYVNASRTTTRTTEAWSAGNHGSKMLFKTVDNGTTAFADKLELNTTGVKVSNAYYLPAVDGSANQVIVAAGDGTTSWQDPTTATAGSLGTYSRAGGELLQTGVTVGVHYALAPVGSSSDIGAFEIYSRASDGLDLGHSWIIEASGTFLPVTGTQGLQFAAEIDGKSFFDTGSIVPGVGAFIWTLRVFFYVSTLPNGTDYNLNWKTEYMMDNVTIATAGNVSNIGGGSAQAITFWREFDESNASTTFTCQNTVLYNVYGQSVVLAPTGPVSYGKVYYASNATPTVTAVVDTWYVVAGTFLTSMLTGFTRTLGVMTYTGAETRVFAVHANWSAILVSSSNNDMEASIFKNGSIVSDSIMGINLGSAGGNPKAASSVSLISLATNDTIEIRVRNRTDTISVVVEYVSLLIT